MDRRTAELLALDALSRGDITALLEAKRTLHGELRAEETEEERIAREERERIERERQPPVPRPPNVPEGYLSREEHQAELNRIGRNEQRDGERKARRELLEMLGLPATASDDDIKRAKDLLEAETRRQRDQESEAERKIREADERDRAAQKRERAADERDLAARKRIALVEGGCQAAYLTDAATLLESVALDTSDEDVQTAVTKLKERHGHMFGVTPAPPIPGGGPGPGTPPRQNDGDAYTRGAERARGGATPAQPATRSNWV